MKSKTFKLRGQNRRFHCLIWNKSKAECLKAAAQLRRADEHQYGVPTRVVPVENGYAVFACLAKDQRIKKRK